MREALEGMVLWANLNQPELTTTDSIVSDTEGAEESPSLQSVGACMVLDYMSISQLKECQQKVVPQCPRALRGLHGLLHFPDHQSP